MSPVFTLIHNLLTIFAVCLVFVALGTLMAFFYFVFLRKVIRARRIANLRLNRTMQERDQNQL